MPKAIILLSGGLDSTTCLAIAKSQGYECYALSVDYGQRHVAELSAAKKIAQHFQVSEHKILNVDLSSLADHHLQIQNSKLLTTLTHQIFPILMFPPATRLCYH